MSLVPGVKDTAIQSVTLSNGVSFQREYCDRCENIAWVRRIELGGQAGINICAACFHWEMTYRTMRNKQANSTLFHVFAWGETDPAQTFLLLGFSVNPQKGERNDQS